MHNLNKNIIVASKSPRRRELMTQIGMTFEVMESTVEEVITKSDPAEVVMELADIKASDVYEKNIEKQQNIVVIGADTVVAIDGKILGKPKTKACAFDMLKMLQGNSHQVYTGVTFVWHNMGIKKHSFFAKTDVEFFDMTDSEIEAYIETGDCMDKAGSYGIQGLCAKHIKEIRGDYNNVVGLPVSMVYQELKKLGLL